MQWLQRPMGIIFFGLLIQGCNSLPQKQVTSVNISSGYVTEAWYYPPAEKSLNVAILHMHGKSATPDAPHNARFIQEMRQLGYPVYALLMPWAGERYQGSVQDGLNSLARLIEQVPAERVLITGHSMGGMAALQYAASTTNPKVLGAVSIAPGHDPNTNTYLRAHTAQSAAQACLLMDQGEGNSRRSYKEMNSGRTYNIQATAEYYCTHYQAGRYPDSRQMAKQAKIPVFILSGSGDKLTKTYHHHALFASLPESSKHRHEVLSGNHGEVLYRHPEVIDEWVKQL
jgi:pimeloyl-ACP methyl ester carboxylesterase